MTNKVSWQDVNYGKIQIGEPSKKEITKSKGYWYYIPISYLYENGETDTLRIEFVGMKTSGICISEFDDSSKISYQFGTLGNLDDKYVKFFDKLRKAICELILKITDKVEYLDGFDPDAKKPNPKLFYWRDKKDKSRRRWYPTIGKNTTFFLPDSKSKTKTKVISRKDILENQDKNLRFELEQSPIWEIKYFYVGAQVTSIKNEIYQSLVTKLSVKGATSAQADEAENYLASNPEQEDLNSENLRSARVFLASAEVDDSDVDDSDADDFAEEKPKKKGKAKAKVSKDLDRIINNSDSDSDQPSKKKKEKKKEKQSDNDSEKSDEAPKKKKDKKKKPQEDSGSGSE